MLEPISPHERLTGPGTAIDSQEASTDAPACRDAEDWVLNTDRAVTEVANHGSGPKAAAGRCPSVEPKSPHERLTHPGTDIDSQEASTDAPDCRDAENWMLDTDRAEIEVANNGGGPKAAESGTEVAT